MVGGIVIGLSLAAIGGFFVYALLAHGLAKAVDADNWIETHCTISKSEIRTWKPSPNSGLTHELDIVYHYSIDGKEYTSKQFRRTAMRSGHKEKVRKAMGQFPAGSEATCFVNPDNPSEAILKKDTKAVGYTVWFPGLFVVGGLGIAIASVRRYLKSQK